MKHNKLVSALITSGVISLSLGGMAIAAPCRANPCAPRSSRMNPCAAKKSVCGEEPVRCKNEPVWRQPLCRRDGQDEYDGGDAPEKLQTLPGQ